jgi:hypothetical protein
VNGHALKPAQKARQVREAAVDALLLKAAAGDLSIPEGVLLAECWREERRLDALTRRRLTDTTRALERHREAAGGEIRRLEAELSSAAGSPDAAPDGPRAALSSPLAAPDGFGGDREGPASPGASESRTGDPGPDVPRQAA